MRIFLLSFMSGTIRLCLTLGGMILNGWFGVRVTSVVNVGTSLQAIIIIAFVVAGLISGVVISHLIVNLVWEQFDKQS